MKSYYTSILFIAVTSCTLPKKECPDPNAANYVAGANPASDEACLYSAEARFYSESLNNGAVTIYHKKNTGTFELIGTITDSMNSANCDTPELIGVIGDSYEVGQFILTDSLGSDTIDLIYPKYGCMVINTDDY